MIDPAKRDRNFSFINSVYELKDESRMTNRIPERINTFGVLAPGLSIVE